MVDLDRELCHILIHLFLWKKVKEEAKYVNIL